VVLLLLIALVMFVGMLRTCTAVPARDAEHYTTEFTPVLL